MHWLKSLLQDLYALFAHNSKKSWEIHKPINLINIKNNKFLQNVNIPWISMASQSKEGVC